MLFARRAAIATLIAFTAFTTKASDQILNLGDPAPPLAISSWVKGDKVDSFDSAKTYVVEFWATWCGPCRASIPHLTELAHQYKDKVQFIGVDVWEDDQKKVQPFVDELGDQMDYSVALDTVSTGADQFDGTMSNTWLKAAVEGGIPTAFVIHAGKIAWIGHPIKLDEPLAKIVAGQWDNTDRIKQRLAQKTKERRMEPIEAKVRPLFETKDYKAMLTAIDDAAKTDPLLADDFGWLKLVAFYKTGEVDRALGLSDAVLKASWDDADQLNELAWSLVDPDSNTDPVPNGIELALKAAKRAVQLTDYQDAGLIDTMAEAQFRGGDVASAIATEQSAIKILEAKTKGKTTDELSELRKHLDRYQQSATAKPDKIP